jgi:ribosomal protein S27E
MIVHCGACSAQNFVSPERLAVREVPPRCWECGRVLAIPGEGSGTVREIPDETRRMDKASKWDMDGKN